MKLTKIAKKRLLGVMTASAIVITVAGSYAAWDLLTATSTANVTFNRVAVTTTSTNVELTTPERVLNTETPPSYSGDVTFNITGIPSDKRGNLNFVSIVRDDKNEIVDNTAYELTVKQGNNIIDNDHPSTVGNGEETYTVTITPKGDDNGIALANKVLSVQIDATLDTTLVNATPTP